MTSAILPFIVPMLLGRTIDLRTYEVGSSIYDDHNYVEIPRGVLNTSYHVFQEDSFPYAAFGMPIDMVLRIKSDYLATGSGSVGLGGLLKETSWKFNSVVIALVAKYSTVVRQLQNNAVLFPNWKEKTRITQTHYADKIQYGVWCVALYRFKCDIPGDLKVVRESLTDSLGVSGAVDSNMQTRWMNALKALKANEDIRGKVEIKFSIYSSFQLPRALSSLEEIIEFFNDIPKLVDSSGQPMIMQLKPLNDIDKDFDKVEEIKLEIEDDLKKLDDMFDDVKITKEKLVKWTTKTDKLFSDEEEERIYVLLQKVNSCIRSFNRVSDGISRFKEMDDSKLGLALHEYLKGLEKGSRTYNVAYLKLKEEIDPGCENSFLHKIKGLLRVYDEEKIEKGKVAGGLEECKKICLEDNRCRAVGYASHTSELDMSTGQYFKNEKQCWIYYRSTNTAAVYTPDGLSGDMGVYDRKCYLN